MGVIKEFIIKNFFFIVKLIICTGIALCIYAIHTKEQKSKKTSNDLIKDNAHIGEGNITNSKENLSENSGILMGFGVTAVVAGIILLLLGFVALIIVIYILMHLKVLFDALD